jgi:hypothetical protein
MVRFQYGDDVYEILRGGTPDGALVGLNAVAGRYSQLSQPLLEAIWNTDDKTFSFIAYAQGIELPFEVVEQLISIARSWLPPIVTLEQG